MFAQSRRQLAVERAQHDSPVDGRAECELQAVTLLLPVVELDPGCRAVALSTTSAVPRCALDVPLGLRRPKPTRSVAMNNRTAEPT